MRSDPRGVLRKKHKRGKTQVVGNGAPRKKATFEKKMILFPDLAAKKREDEYLAEFLARAEGDPFANMTQIEPEEMEYNFPDFGFDNELTFVDSDQSVGGYSVYWKFFGDYMAPFPKFQRLKNYIKFVTERKEEEMQQLGYST